MITTLTGANSFALGAELDRLLRDFIAAHGEMAVEKVDGEEAGYERITEAINSIPFLASKKLVILNRPGAQKAFAENLEHIIESISDSTDVVIVEPKPDKRSTYYKQLQKKTSLQAFDEIGTNELPRWLTERAKTAAGSLSVADAAYLIERVGANQQLLANEVDKLLTYDPKITRTSIDLLTEPTPASSVFQLLDAAFAGDAKRAMKLYQDQRSQRVEPLAIMAMLAWQLHVLAIVKTAGDRSSADIAREAKLNPFVVQKSAQAARRLSGPQLKKLVHDLSQLDIRLKSTGIDADEALQHYLLTVAGI